MNTKLTLWGLLIAGAVALSGCAAPAAGNGGDAQAVASPAATMAKEDQMLATAAPDKMMATATPEKMMDDTAAATPEKMMDDTAAATPEKMMDDTAAAMPGWLSAALTDVTTGETFAVADLKGKVVLVETMAIWCPTCLRQQREVVKLKESLGERDDFATVTLDVDPNEQADALKAYAAKHGFGGRYAVAGAAVAREIATLYGDQFINPPAAPMLVIDRQGMAHPLPFGVKDAAALQAAVEKYLAEGM